MAASILDATRSASRTLRTGPSRIPNSSEPRRATVSVDRAAVTEALADLDEQQVAGRVPQALVDDLEPVEVEEDQRDPRRRSRVAGRARARRLASICSASRFRSIVRLGRPVSGS